MKSFKTVFIWTLMIMALASCSKVERNEKKFLKAMQSDDYQTVTDGYKEFTDWMQRDKSTMNYDFPLLQENLNMKIATSQDGHLRCYSWPTSTSNGLKVYANLSQWTAGDNFIGFNGPIDQLLAGRKGDLQHKHMMGHSIDSIIDIQLGQRTCYVIIQSYKNTEGRYRAYASVTHIDGVVLRLLPFFFDGTEVAGNYEFISGGNVKTSDLFKWDPQTKRFYAYQTDDNYKIIPGKYTAYQLGADRFTRLPDE